MTGSIQIRGISHTSGAWRCIPGREVEQRPVELAGLVRSNQTCGHAPKGFVLDVRDKTKTPAQHASHVHVDYGTGAPKLKQMTAWAVYLPTPGSASKSSRLLGT